jgi:hypothetical protein
MLLKPCLKLMLGFLLWQNAVQQLRADMHWGAETNGLKAGLDIVVRTNESGHGLDRVHCLAWLLFQTNAATVYAQGVDSNTNTFVHALFVKYNGVILTNGKPIEDLYTNLGGRWTLRERIINGRERITNGKPYEYSYTNLLVYADGSVLMPMEKNMRLRLKDENGKDVSRTERGERSRRTFVDNPVFVDSRWGWKSWNVGEARQFADSFQLDDYFKVTQPGKYHLQMQIRIFPRYLPGKYDKPLFLPPIDVEIDIHSKLNSPRQP